MKTSVKVVGFFAGLAAVFVVAIGVGNAVGPFSEPTPAAHDADHKAAPTPSRAEPAGGAEADTPGGLMVSQDGYALVLSEPQAPAGRDVPVAFMIAGPDGSPVTAYDVEHERRLHLIAVRRDFSGFQHVHPELDSDGVWSTGLDLTAGQWRLFADFKATAAEPLTLGTDLTVAGDYQPVAPSGDSRTAEVDGYTVTLEGDLAPGADAKLRLSVSRDGQTVSDLQPYLGAYGHLVALREGDLAYLHVHPDGAPDDGTTQPGPDVVFYAAVPSTGTYHLYLDFKHRGVVRTAAFTVTASGADHTSPSTSEPSAPAEDGHSGH